MSAQAIDSLLREERVFPPSEAFTAQANLTKGSYDAMVEQARKDPEGYWGNLARQELDWTKPFTQVLDDSDAPSYKWFADGRLNASAQCLDAHLGTPTADKPAILWESENGETRRLTYQELHDEVCRLANVLKELGIETGDRVVIYMPMVPEVAIAMLACARIGATHSVVFGGFSAEALADRLEDAGARLLLTADGSWRGGNHVDLKKNADKALERDGLAVEKTIVLANTKEEVPFTEGRDIWWHDVVQEAGPTCEPTPVGAEHPLYILYTSGSTGKPKGIVHSTAGYMLWAKLTTRWVFDLKPDDIYWCTADVGWVTGHTYILYGPMANGATQVMYEGAPTHPGPDRFWDIVERHKVSLFYTAPTAIRALMKAGDKWPQKHDLSSLRLLGTVGEPINPEAWMWYHKTIGNERCPIVDTWWQTETGGILLSPLPGATPLKPGSCTRPLPGIFPEIVGEDGQPVDDPEAGGYLVMTRPWPSMLRTIWGDDQRYIDTYWKQFDNKYYVAGDTAHRDKDGYHWIMGRFDDVLNVSGHRLGTMEVESALVAHPDVAEAAVVGRPHDVKGEAIAAFVILKSGEGSEEKVQELREHVGKAIGPIAKPDDIRFADALPKTRSGKIMRRILRSIARGEKIEQDTSTLENEDAVLKLQE